MSMTSNLHRSPSAESTLDDEELNDPPIDEHGSQLNAGHTGNEEVAHNTAHRLRMEDSTLRDLGSKTHRSTFHRSVMPEWLGKSSMQRRLEGFASSSSSARSENVAHSSMISSFARHGEETEGTHTYRPMSFKSSESSVLRALDEIPINHPQRGESRSASRGLDDDATVTSRDAKKDQEEDHRKPVRRRPQKSQKEATDNSKKVPVISIPLPFRKIFKFSHFNEMQSTLFQELIQGKENVVVTAPTGSGKTVLFELALIQMLQSSARGKAVYLAPIKALCSERVNDWNARFKAINCKILEMTGDAQTWTKKDIESSRLIVATPEMWDNVTRRAHLDDPLLCDLELFIVDEIHSVRENIRGARLEVIIARTKMRSPHTRILAVSATIPNAKDIATWIGVRNMPGARLNEKCLEPFVFSELFRPCPLEKFVYGYQTSFRSDNYVAFEKYLDTRLPDIISMHSEGKPTLIFCASRNGVERAASHLARHKESEEAQSDTQARIQTPFNFKNQQLKELSLHGIAFHHAGIDISDRRLVEQYFLEGRLRILCATTTLAMGINLPAFLVIVRGTKIFNSKFEWESHNDLTVLQMIGRAGRPQFDTKGVAAIMTEDEDRSEWDALLGGHTTIESTLHHDLTEHLNAEVAVRHTCTPKSIAHWLKGTFFFARLKENPEFYCLPGCESARDAEDAISIISQHILGILSENDLVVGYEKGRPNCNVSSTAYGNIMTNYFLRFETMLKLLALPHAFGIDMLVTAISETEDFKSIFYRQGERAILDSLRRLGGIVLANRARSDTAEKVYILLQANLAGLPISDVYHEFGARSGVFNPQAEYKRILDVGIKMARAALSIALQRKDGLGANAALTLSRAMSGGAWDDCSKVMKQVEGVGDAYCQTLEEAGITDCYSLASAKASRIQMLLGKSMSSVHKVIREAKRIPRLQLYVNEVSRERLRDDLIDCEVEIQIDLNHSAAERDNIMTAKKGGQPHNVGVLVFTLNQSTEVCLWRKIMLARIVQSSSSFRVTCRMQLPEDEIHVISAVEEIAGTAVSAKYRPMARRHEAHRSSGDHVIQAQASSRVKNNSSTDRSDATNRHLRKQSESYGRTYLPTASNSSNEKMLQSRWTAYNTAPKGISAFSAPRQSLSGGGIRMLHAGDLSSDDRMSAIEAKEVQQGRHNLQTAIQKHSPSSTFQSTASFGKDPWNQQSPRSRVAKGPNKTTEECRRAESESSDEIPLQEEALSRKRARKQNLHVDTNRLGGPQNRFRGAEKSTSDTRQSCGGTPIDLCYELSDEEGSEKSYMFSDDWPIDDNPYQSDAFAQPSSSSYPRAPTSINQQPSSVKQTNMWEHQLSHPPDEEEFQDAFATDEGEDWFLHHVGEINSQDMKP